MINITKINKTYSSKTVFFCSVLTRSDLQLVGCYFLWLKICFELQRKFTGMVTFARYLKVTTYLRVPIIVSDTRYCSYNFNHNFLVINLVAELFHYCTITCKITLFCILHLVYFKYKCDILKFQLSALWKPSMLDFF